jgi:hypothetical protein
MEFTPFNLYNMNGNRTPNVNVFPQDDAEQRTKVRVPVGVRSVAEHSR